MTDGLDFDIKIDNQSAEVLEALKTRAEDCLYIMGTRAVAGAVDSISFDNLAVKTGRLRASISFVTAGGNVGQSDKPSDNSQAGDTLSGKAAENSVYVGTNVEYAQFVHNGTSKMGARPFLKDGIENNREYIQEGVKGVLEGKY